VVSIIPDRLNGGFAPIGSSMRGGAIVEGTNGYKADVIHNKAATSNALFIEGAQRRCAIGPEES
jgi:hypothetical protein